MTLHEMKLGDFITREFADMRVVRVPGGWIFIDYHLENHSQSQSFVPYSSEFDPAWKGFAESGATAPNMAKPAINYLNNVCENH